MVQLAFIRGQAQCINAGRERFLRDRERIVQDMIAKVYIVLVPKRVSLNLLF